MVLVWNVTQHFHYTGRTLPYPQSNTVLWWMSLWQYWDMFAPLPIQYDGWLVMPAQFENGIEIDVFTRQAVNYDRPTRWHWGPDMKWEKLEENMYRFQEPEILGSIAGYYCRFYNVQRHAIRGTRLATLQIHYVSRASVPPDTPWNDYQVEEIWTHWCFDEYAPDAD